MGYRQASDDPWIDAVIVSREFGLSWLERLRVLFRGRIQVYVRVRTEHVVGKTTCERFDLNVPGGLPLFAPKEGTPPR